MTEQSQDLGRIVSLRIDVTSYGGDDRDVLFSMVTEGGAPFNVNVTSSAVNLQDFDEQVAAVGANTAQLPAGVRLGKPNGEYVLFEVDAGRTLRTTYPVSSAATPVSDAALARLAADVHQVVEAANGTVDWAVAD